MIRFAILLICITFKPAESCVNCCLSESCSLNHSQPKNLCGNNSTCFHVDDKKQPRVSALQFLEIPKGDELAINKLEFAEDSFFFEIFSHVMDYLLPRDFPTELVRDTLRQIVPFHLFIFQLLKSEVLVLVFLLFFTIITILIPFTVFTYFCCTKTNLQRLRDDTDMLMDFRSRCIERTLTLLLLFFLTLQLCCIILIFIANEHISNQILQAHPNAELLFDDLQTFTRNTNMQMSFIATSSTDITIEAIRRDLDEVETLLGLPIQEELSRLSKIELLFADLEEIQQTSSESSSLISQLISTCSSANKARNSLQEKLKQLARELALIRQQCKSRDRSLCYTLQYSGFDVTFSCGNFSVHPVLLRLKQDNRLKEEIEFSRGVFQQVPLKVAEETATQITEIKSGLREKRTEMYKAVHNLDLSSRSLLSSINSYKKVSLEKLEELRKWEVYRWLSLLGISMIILLVWGLLLYGAPCGCGFTPKTIPSLLSGIILTAFIIILIWSLALATFLIGSHTNSLICRPLYQPNYHTLQTLFSQPALPQILNNCQLNQPTYTTFELNFFNTSTQLNLNLTLAPNWEILTPSLQLNLQFLASCNVNVSDFRTSISTLTRKDLNSLADQFSNVARQILDPVTSRNVDQIAAKLRQIIRTEYTKLRDLRDELQYKLTKLDLILEPLHHRANRSLTQLKDVQFLIDFQSEKIVRKSVQQFEKRLDSYWSLMSQFVGMKVKKEIGRCRPLWEIFNSSRYFLCKLIVAPINAIAACSFALIIFFLGVVIVVLNLVEHYRALNEELLTSITHRRTRDGVIIDDESTWATPPSITPPEEQVWMTAPGAEPLLPPPPPRMPTRSPKRLSTIASRITASRVPQIPSVSRARSPTRNRESLRLIEPICWKSG